MLSWGPEGVEALSGMIANVVIPPPPPIKQKVPCSLSDQLQDPSAGQRVRAPLYRPFHFGSWGLTSSTMR